MPEGTDTMTPLWRAVVALRLVCAVFAAAAIVVHHGGYARPQLGLAVLVAILVWTAVVTVAYSRDTGRRLAVIGADLAVTLVLMGASAWVLSADQLAEVSERTPLLTTVWASGPVVAAAVHLGRIGGVAAGTAVSLANWLVRGVVSTDIARDTVLLVGTGFVLGLAAVTMRRAGEQLRRAARAQAAAAERERLVSPDSATAGDADLGSALRLLVGPRVAVSVPAGPVSLPAGDVEELVAVVTEALSNTERHAGPDATSWLLVQDLGDEVVLTVRDDGDGDGMVDGTPAGAEASGRMAVARSIRGRVADLGGTLSLDSTPGRGTEWKVRLARTRTGSSR